MSYTHLEGGWILRTSDGAHIPPDPANRDRIEFLAWEAEGGVAEHCDFAYGELRNTKAGACRPQRCGAGRVCNVVQEGLICTT
jgi:hypothetical protein